MDNLVAIGCGIVAFVCTTFLIIVGAARWLKRSDEPGRVVVLWIITGVVFLFWMYLGANLNRFGPMTPGLAAASGLFLSIFWAPHIAAAISKPLASFYEGGDPEDEVRPLYSMAESRRKRGQYQQALAEVYKQLERFPEDYQGWMLRAEIQAENLHDLPAALATVEHVLSLETVAPKNIAYALGRAADWHLKFDRDPGAARAALERIIERLPDTEEARIALQRIAHLATPEHLAQHERVIALPHQERKLGLESKQIEAAPEESAEARINGFVERLREFPEDNETRELLARAYADDLKRLDLATLELEQLIAAPHQKRQHIVHWLNLLADAQIKLAGDVALARQTLQRIVELFPDSAGAATAQVKMSQLNLQLNQRAPQRTVKMGSYEQNIGLRKMNSSGSREQTD